MVRVLAYETEGPGFNSQLKTFHKTEKPLSWLERRAWQP